MTNHTEFYKGERDTGILCGRVVRQGQGKGGTMHTGVGGKQEEAEEGLL